MAAETLAGATNKKWERSGWSRSRVGSGGVGGVVSLQVRYEAHLHALSLLGGGGGGGLSIIMIEAILPKVKFHVLCQNCHLCVLCWDGRECKNFYVLTSPDVAAAMIRMLMTAKRECQSHLQPSVCMPTSPIRPPSYLNLTHQGEYRRWTGAT